MGPVHEAVQAFVGVNDVLTWTQHKMEGVAQDNLGSQTFQLLGGHRFHSAVRTHWHECRRFDYAMRQCQATQPGGAVCSQQFELGSQPGVLLAGAVVAGAVLAGAVVGAAFGCASAVAEMFAVAGAFAVAETFAAALVKNIASP